MTREIELSRGMVALVDDADYDALKAFAWTAKPAKNTHYALHSWCRGGKRGNVLMHRMIMQPPPGMIIDHKDRNGLNNTRANLRICTAKENGKNSPKRGANLYKGVKLTTKGRWQTDIGFNGRAKYIGSFDDPITAALAFDLAGPIFHGEFHYPNFDPRRDWLFPSADMAALEKVAAKLGVEPKAFAPRDRGRT